LTPARIAAAANGLFAIDRLAGGDCRQRDLAMQIAGHADVDNVDGWIVDQPPPIRRVAVKAQALGRRGCQLRRGLGQ